MPAKRQDRYDRTQNMANRGYSGSQKSVPIVHSAPRGVKRGKPCLAHECHPNRVSFSIQVIFVTKMPPFVMLLPTKGVLSKPECDAHTARSAGYKHISTSGLSAALGAGLFRAGMERYMGGKSAALARFAGDGDVPAMLLNNRT